MKDKSKKRYKGSKEKQLKRIFRRNPEVIMEIDSQISPIETMEKEKEQSQEKKISEKYRETVQEILNADPKNPDDKKKSDLESGKSSNENISSPQKSSSKQKSSEKSKNSDEEDKLALI